MPPQVIYLIVSILIVYFRTLNYNFVSDDVDVSRRRADKPSLKNVQEVYRDKKGKEHKVKNRLHRIWLHTIGAVYFEHSSPHLITLLLHTLLCVLIYYKFGILTAFLFAFNPVNTQGGSIWMSGKIYCISSILAVAIFIFPWIAPILYLSTKWFSINAMFAPLAFIHTPHWWLATMPIIGWYMFKRILKTKRIYGTNNEMAKAHLLKVVPFIKTYGYYMFLCLVPWRIALYHSFLWGVGVTKRYNQDAYRPDKSFWLGLLLMCFTVSTISWFWGTPLSFGLLWFFVNILMWCNFITLQQQISERCVHTANIGLMYALAYVISPHPIAIAVVMTFYLTRLWFIMPMYKNEYWHTEYSKTESPRCAYIWVSKGLKKNAMKDYVGAFYDFMEARHITPWEFKANFNAANMAIIMQDFNTAENLLNDASKCPYQGSQRKLNKLISVSREVIKQAKEKKVIDMNKIQIVR